MGKYPMSKKFFKLSTKKLFDFLVNFFSDQDRETYEESCIIFLNPKYT